LERLEHNDFFYPGLGLGLSYGLQFGIVQARILAIRYPGETEAFALRIASDPKSTDSDLQFAAKVLGILASRNSSAALEALLKLAQGEKVAVVSVALEAIFSLDREGQYRALYPAACKRDILEVFDLGPYWVDEETKRTLEDIRRKNLEQYSEDSFTKEALERMRILESPERSSRLEALVKGEPPGNQWSPDFSDERQRWALRVLEKSPSPRVLECLRLRLEKEERFFAEWDRVHVGPTHPGWTETSDYDEYLIAYAALGGKLNKVENERLTYYGYGDDPGPRLRELLAHW
jgi:hypothetical protein